MGQPIVAISDDFLGAFAKLPKAVQASAITFINKFRNNPRSSAINYEKVVNAVDDKMHSVRINDAYRAIIAHEDSSEVYLLLWIDHHDEAYQWAMKKKCEINKITGSVQVFDVVEKGTVEVESTSELLFSKFTDNQLIQIGVPENQLELVRNVVDLDDFYAKTASFAKDTYEYLEWLANGFTYEEVLELVKSEQEENVPENLEEALKTSHSKQSFVVVEGEDELLQIMSEPLEKWRIFLHPSQRKLVERSFKGPARVTGGAGTGKTVVAMHRAKELVKRLDAGKRILFTTYTANLAGDIIENLRKICSSQDLKKIEVIHLDSWLTHFLKLNGYNYVVDYDQIPDMWEQALAQSGEHLDLTADYIAEEYSKIAIVQDEFSLASYMSASRIGRGIRLDRGTKAKIWKVFQEYLRIIRDKQIRDVDTAMYECRKILANNPSSVDYQFIIIDEGQDFGVNAYKLLRLIAGPEHDNDMFIVGDAHQRIYKKKAPLSKCGINVKGRSSLLKINYRTTEEIRRYAFALLKGIPFDNLDGEVESQDKCQSLTHGEKPVIKNFKDANAEFEYVKEEINRLIESGADGRNICVVCRTNKYIDEYLSNFTNAGIKTYEIRRSKIDDRNKDGIRIATMHRVKGLEFRYVFVVCCNDRVVPLASAINSEDPISREESIVSEKCLLYVALTRAQKQAYICSYGKPSEFIKSELMDE